jgi:hypothetical protein
MNTIEMYRAEVAYRREHMRPDPQQVRMLRLLWSARATTPKIRTR